MTGLMYEHDDDWSDALVPKTGGVSILALMIEDPDCTVAELRPGFYFESKLYNATERSYWPDND